MKILILTTEPLPYPGIVPTGAGLRAWQLGEGLKSAGFDKVIVAMPSTFREQAPEKDFVPEEVCFNRKKVTEYIHQQQPDVVILQHWGLARELDYVECPLVIDLAGPHLLERYYWGEKNLTETMAEKVSALRKADFVICGSQRQRYYFLPFMINAGYEPLPDLLPVVPFSVSPELPEPVDNRQFDEFVYGGMLLPWQDPEQPLRILIEVLSSRGKGYLNFYGGPHPLGDVSGGKFLDLLELLRNHPRVKCHPLMPFNAIVEEYLKAGVALDVMGRNFERELASTTRTIIYLWCGVPVIHHSYTELASFIDYYSAGWVVNPGDEREIAECINYILDHPEEVRRRGRNAQRMIAEHFTWDRTIKPLAHFCRQPYIRKDKEKIALVAETADMQLQRVKREYEICRRELATLKGKKIFKLYEKFGSFSFLLVPVVFLWGVFVSLSLFTIFVGNEVMTLFLHKRRREK